MNPDHKKQETVDPCAVDKFFKTMNRGFWPSETFTKEIKKDFFGMEKVQVAVKEDNGPVIFTDKQHNSIIMNTDDQMKISVRHFCLDKKNKAEKEFDLLQQGFRDFTQYATANRFNEIIESFTRGKSHVHFFGEGKFPTAVRSTELSFPDMSKIEFIATYPIFSGGSSEIFVILPSLEAKILHYSKANDLHNSAGHVDKAYFTTNGRFLEALDSKDKVEVLYDFSMNQSSTTQAKQREIDYLSQIISV